MSLTVPIECTCCSLLLPLTIRVKSVSESQLTVESGRFKGRVHITMVTDKPSGEDSPLSAYKPSDLIKARVLKIRQAPGHKAALELCTMERWVNGNVPQCSTLLTSVWLQWGHQMTKWNGSSTYFNVVFFKREAPCTEWSEVLGLTSKSALKQITKTPPHPFRAFDNKPLNLGLSCA